jgi:4-carboxymuconolactone decarboxylase
MGEKEMKKSIAWGTAILFGAGVGLLAGAANPAKSREPRFAQLTMEQLDDRQRPLAEDIVRYSNLGGPYNLLLRSPGAAKPMLDLLDYLRHQSGLSNRLIEFTILVQARVWRSQNEWHGHSPAALKAGVPEKTIAELKANQRPTQMPPEEAAVYDFCRELHEKHQTSDATFSRLRQYFNEQQIVDITLLAGTYATVASLMIMADTNVMGGDEPPFKPGDP